MEAVQLTRALKEAIAAGVPVEEIVQAELKNHNRCTAMLLDIPTEMNTATRVLRSGVNHKQVALTRLDLLGERYAWTNFVPVALLMPSGPDHWWISPYRDVVLRVSKADLQFELPFI